MAAHHHCDIQEIKARLLRIVEEIVAGIMEGFYEDDKRLYVSITVLLSAIDSCGLSDDTVSSGSESADSITAVLEDAPLSTPILGKTDDGAENNDVQSIAVASRGALPSGDAPFSELGPVDPTRTLENGPLGDVVMRKQDVMLAEDVEPAQGNDEEPDSGEVVGRLDPSATTGKSADQPRRYKTSCWTGVRRIFRRLCCWRRETVRGPR